MCSGIPPFCVLSSTGPPEPSRNGRGVITKARRRTLQYRQARRGLDRYLRGPIIRIVNEYISVGEQAGRGSVAAGS